MADAHIETGGADISVRALLRLAAPILVAQLAVMGLGIVDTVMAGRRAATDLAAVAIGASVYASIYVGLMVVLQAMTPIAGHHFGAGLTDEIGVDLVQALWLTLSLALLGAPLLAWTAPWLKLVEAPADVPPRAGIGPAPYGKSRFSHAHAMRGRVGRRSAFRTLSPLRRDPTTVVPATGTAQARAAKRSDGPALQTGRQPARFAGRPRDLIDPRTAARRSGPRSADARKRAPSWNPAGWRSPST